MIQTVKLVKLQLSDSNVRKTGALDLDPLAADILARGVLQNLLVTPIGRTRGQFAVFGGGRRLRALLLLAERGAIDVATYDVPVRVLKADASALSEISTAENFQRLAMTPADECRAFQHFLGEDGDIDAVATRFGVTRRFIEGRLRLAALAEPIFAALSRGELTLDLAKAYAATENHERQLHVFNSYGGHSYVNADSIRRAIVSETIQATDPVALLVGEAAYAAAGGRVDHDLFGDHGDRWRDPEIAHRLAAEAMEAEAARIGAETGLAWIRPITSSYAYDAARDLHPVALAPAPLDEQQTARLEAIDARIDVLDTEMEDEQLDDPGYAMRETERAALEAERDALADRPRQLPDDLRPLVGAFLVLTPTGEMKLDTRFYSEKPLRRGTSGEAEGMGARDGSQPSPERTAPGGKPLSARLGDELAMQGRDVLAAALLAQPALALDYALFVMADGQRHHDDLGSTIAARAPNDPVIGAVPPSRARGFVAEAVDGLDARWCEPRSVVDRFEAFRALDDDAKAGWLAVVVASSLEARPRYTAAGRSPLHHRLADILELDVAQWWRPTCENFFDRVSKASLLALLGEVGGATLAARFASAKKGEISESCQKLFAGDAIVEAEVKERALAWVPAAMRFTGAAANAMIEDDGEAEDAIAPDREAEGEVAETPLDGLTEETVVDAA